MAKPTPRRFGKMRQLPSGRWPLRAEPWRWLNR